MPTHFCYSSGMAADVGWRSVAVGNLDDGGKTCVVEIMCTRELGDPFRRDALSQPVRLLEKYKDYAGYASRLSPE